MTDFSIENLFKSKNTLTDSSIKLYTKNILRLNNDVEPKNLNFLKDVEKILERINKYKPTTQRSYLIAIVSLLKELPKMKKVHDKYYELMMGMNKELKENNTKSDSQKDNWMDQEQVKEVYNNLENEVKAMIENKKKLNADEYNKLLKYFLLSLYVLQKPRRNMDYQKMLISKSSVPTDLNNEFNYLDLENGKFIFNNYKTKGTYKTQEVDVTPEMKKVIDIFLKFHPCKKYMKTKKDLIMMLVNYDETPFENNNDITRMLNKIFGKKIGVSMLRSIYLTDKFGNDVEQLKETSQEMGTSNSTILNNYIKVEDK
jgi:hypothetical protein